jgi:photosystem II stability/assembly factor-like uncharacterized protein
MNSPFVTGKTGLTLTLFIFFTLGALQMLPVMATPCVKADVISGWYEQESGTEENLWGISAVDSNTAWAAGDLGVILKTTDGGTTWLPQASGATDRIWEVSAVDVNTAWAVIGYGEIIKTTDGGNTWKQQADVSKYLRGISAVDSSTAWAAGDYGIVLKTTDGGNTWKPQTTSTSQNFDSISAVDSYTAWAVGDVGMVYKTINGGTVWSPQDSGTDRGLNEVFALDADTAWAVGDVGTLIKTADGGNTWKSMDLDTPVNLEGVAAVDSNTAWVVGGWYGSVYRFREIFKTVDGGKTWETQISDPNQQGLLGVDALDEESAWAVGGYGSIIRTEGGGKEYLWYFAEGYTGQGFQEYLCLGNPREEEATVVITYMFNDAGAQEQRIEIPPLSRTTINVNQEVGAGREVSAVVTSDKDIVAERPMYFNYNGTWAGGHNVMGTTEVSNVWCFAEGYTGLGFEEWICVLNPSDETVFLAFRFQTEKAGEIEKSGGYSIPAHSRSSFKVNEILGDHHQASLVLDAKGYVVAERAMYFDYFGMEGCHWQGGHCVVGVPELPKDKEFYFAEGTTREGFEEWLSIQNPSNISPITVQATYQLDRGEPIEKTYNIQEGHRRSILVSDEIGKGKDVSVKLTSDSNFLAERPIYFNYDYAGLSVQGGHCAIGTKSSASLWYFAEGCTAAGFNQWLCLQNPGNQKSTVEITYFTQEEGAVIGETVDVAPHARQTVMVNEHAGWGYQLSCAVNVTSGPGIIVERPLYFNYFGWDGGHIVVGCNRD